MKATNIFIRALDYLKRIEAALDYDAVEDIGRRIRELELEAQLRRNELAALTMEVRALGRASARKRS